MPARGGVKTPSSSWSLPIGIATFRQPPKTRHQEFLKQWPITVKEAHGSPMRSTQERSHAAWRVITHHAMANPRYDRKQAYLGISAPSGAVSDAVRASYRSLGASKAIFPLSLHPAPLSPHLIVKPSYHITTAHPVIIGEQTRPNHLMRLSTLREGKTPW